jgi:zinc transporter, ZIP family
MGLGETLLLGGIAGSTIFLGLPIARWRHAPLAVRGFLNALATGILIFLLWDVISGATQPIDAALQAAKHGNANAFGRLVAVFVFGFGVALFSLVYVQRLLISRAAVSARSESGSPVRLSAMIAIGIGLHNLSEGLAIGQAARTGAISLATVLIIGFAAHNATEGFGIGAPFGAAQLLPSWRFLALAGLVGGGPTFIGTVLGHAVQSDTLYVLFLALAAGSILYVVSELLVVGKRFGAQDVMMAGVFIGFMAGYGTDLIVTWAGA